MYLLLAYTGRSPLEAVSIGVKLLDTDVTLRCNLVTLSDEKNYRAKSEMEENLVVLLGGRVAEKLVLGDISTGASNDIERASAIARAMVTKYGFSEKLGPIVYGSGHDEVFLGREINNSKNYSESIAAAIDQEVRAIIDSAYTKCEKILTDNMDKLHAVAKELFEKEKLDGKEFETIMKSIW